MHVDLLLLLLLEVLEDQRRRLSVVLGSGKQKLKKKKQPTQITVKRIHTETYAVVDAVQKVKVLALAVVGILLVRVGGEASGAVVVDRLEVGAVVGGALLLNLCTHIKNMKIKAR